jgi:hypothetical protein
VDAVVRRRRLLLIALASASCGGAASSGAVGVSERSRGGSQAAREIDAGADPSGAAALPGDYRATFTKVNKRRFVSQGHAGGRWEVDVYANEAAAKALAERARGVPVGAVAVQEHYERAEGRPAGPVMVMEKREPGYAADRGDWRYVVVGASGRLVSEGAAPSCQGCHDQSPMDGLFPIVE